MRAHRTLVGAVLALLVMAAVALGAAPKKGGRFKGTLAGASGPIRVGKFTAPVSFKVSSTGQQVLGFSYSDLGCFGAGGFGNKNPFTFPGGKKKVGPMTVSSTGGFTAASSKSTYKASGGTGASKFTSTTVTTSSVTGRFTSAKKATGSITFSQTLVYNGHHQSCGPATLTFTAKAN